MARVAHTNRFWSCPLPPSVQPVDRGRQCVFMTLPCHCRLAKISVCAHWGENCVLIFKRTKRTRFTGSLSVDKCLTCGVRWLGKRLVLFDVIFFRVLIASTHRALSGVHTRSSVVIGLEMTCVKNGKLLHIIKKTPSKREWGGRGSGLGEVKLNVEENLSYEWCRRMVSVTVSVWQSNRP